MDYDLTLANVGNSPAVVGETISIHEPKEPGGLRQVLVRIGSLLTVAATSDRYPNSYMAQQLGTRERPAVTDQALALPFLDSRVHPAARRLVDALAHIEVHAPFEARPLWQAKELGLTQGPRWPTQVEATDRLARFGVNLPNAFQELRNRGDAVWGRVLERARLGLGSDLRSFRLSPSGRGSIELEIVFGSWPDKPLPAELLSEGQIAFLCMRALCELHANRSLLAFDEPEVHLHPALLARAAWMLEEVAESAPVIVATHSDRLLDALENPAASVVLCKLDQDRTLHTIRPDEAKLAAWLRDYRGLGALRAEGYEAQVFPSGGGLSGGTAQ